MNTNELVETLQNAGLSPYQAKAYVGLLELGSASATEIARASDVPDPRIYDVLRDLEAEGYIETYEQDSLHARAHSPRNVRTDLRSQANRYETAAEEIEERWSRPDIETHDVSIVKRFETVVSKTEDLVRSAENQVQIGLSPSEFDRLSDALAKAKENGVNVRICLFPETDEELSIPQTETLAATSTEVRVRRIPSPFLALIDRSWTCFWPHGGSASEYGVVINDRTHAYVFNWFFLTCLWEVQETVYSARTDETPITYVDIRECVREIEPLLESGGRIRATVTGFETDSGRKVTMRGSVVDVTYAGVSTASETPTPLVQLAGETSFDLETTEGTYTIGGWGATIEDIEATQITVESIE